MNEIAHHFGIVDRGHPRCGDRIGNFSRTGFFLQQCQQRRSVEDRFAHTPESSRRPARNASTDASDFPAVYFRASACACAIDWPTVRRMTPSGVASTSSEPPPPTPRRLRKTEAAPLQTLLRGGISTLLSSPSQP